MKKLRFFPLILIFFIIQCSSNKSISTGETTISGQIIVIGNEPFTKLAVQVADTIVYEIKGDTTLYRQLWNLQNRNITLTGKLNKTPIGNNIVISSYKEQ